MAVVSSAKSTRFGVIDEYAVNVNEQRCTSGRMRKQAADASGFASGLSSTKTALAESGLTASATPQSASL
jgi:hypothetical protein